MKAAAERYGRSRARFDGGVAVARGLFDGLWLGVLDPADVAAIGDRYHATATTCLLRSHNEGGLFRWEDRALARWFSAVTRVAVLAAGAGREVLALHQQGIPVDGYEPDGGLRRLGNAMLIEHGLDVRIYPSAPSEVPRFVQPCDGVIVGWGALTLITPATARVAFLAALSEQLPPRSPVLVSCMLRADGHRYVRTVAGTASLVRRARRRPRVELGDALQPNLTHLFTPSELRRTLLDAGLVPCEQGDDDYGWGVAQTMPTEDLNAVTTATSTKGPPHGL